MGRPKLSSGTQGMTCRWSVPSIMDAAQAAILLTAGPSLLSLLPKPPFPNLEHKKAERDGL